ncbi:MAG: lactate dehydrogenase [Chloroflexi bacterium]|nr:lactate dehydrogenase [Chloroflexota bacterium]
MPDYKVAFLTMFPAETARLIIEPVPSGFQVTTEHTSAPEARKIEILKDADFVILFGERPTDAMLKACHKARMVQLLSAGFDAVNVGLLGEMGIPVANVGGVNRIAVAEHAVTLMLSVLRKLPQRIEAVKTGNWRADVSGLDTFELYNKQVGIVGLGKIGSWVAGILKGFQTHVVYHDIRDIPKKEEQELEVTRVPFEDLLRTSDIVTLHVPLDNTTRDMISTRELAMMKPTAVLVNTCRGPVVDEPALYQALKDRRIWAAGLDVLVKEPPDMSNPILTLDNAIITPHAAGSARDNMPRRGKFAFQNFQRLLSGQEPLSLVTPTAK